VQECNQHSGGQFPVHTQAVSFQFTCNPGYYLVDNAAPTADTCEPCPEIPNSNNVGIQCGAGGANRMADPKKGFKCSFGYRMVYSTLIPIFAVACTKCPDILNSNNVNINCVQTGVWR
jgi:hypothetical protein